MLTQVWPEEVLGFWFGELTPKDWYTKNDDTDAAIRSRFLALHEALASDVPSAALEEQRPALAAIVALDQFPRNLFRGSARAFATDPLALQLARNALEKGFDASLPTAEKQFLYMPLEHSEALADQELSVNLVRLLDDEELTKFAVEHRDIIARFGRFPHRNQALGRESTAQEARFLAEHAGFGQ